MKILKINTHDVVKVVPVLKLIREITGIEAVPAKKIFESCRGLSPECVRYLRVIHEKEEKVDNLVKFLNELCCEAEIIVYDKPNVDLIKKLYSKGTEVCALQMYIGTVEEVDDLGMVKVHLSALNASPWHGPAELRVIG